MTVNLSLTKVQSLRFRAQYLTRELGQGDPETILSGVVGAQAQDLPSAYLSVRARCTGITASGLHQLHLQQRKLTWTWSIRGTLHLIHTDDARWLIPLLGADLISRDWHRMSQLGWTETLAARGIEAIVQLLDEQVEVTRGEIASRLSQKGLPHEGQATVHIIYRAVWEGLISHAGFWGSKPTFRRFEQLHGKYNPVPRDEGLLRLARRYLFAFGPARLQDFVSWSGLRMSEARPAWHTLMDETIDINVGDTCIQFLKERADWLDFNYRSNPSVRLLPRFDTYLLGYENRKWIVEPALEWHIYPGGGLISATVVLDGHVIGTWKMTSRDVHNRIEVILFEAQQKEILQAIKEEVDDISRFLNKPVDLNMESLGRNNPSRNR